MALRKNYRMLPDVDMGPFADIAFLLIIFFILATSLLRPMGRMVDLPSTATETKKKEPPKNLTIKILPDKILFGEDEQSLAPVSHADLREDLLLRDLPAREEKERMVVVMLEGEVPYESFYRVVATISVSGGVVTLIEEEEVEVDQ